MIDPDIEGKAWIVFWCLIIPACILFVVIASNNWSWGN